MKCTTEEFLVIGLKDSFLRLYSRQMSAGKNRRNLAQVKFDHRINLGGLKSSNNKNSLPCCVKCTGFLSLIHDSFTTCLQL